MWIVRPARHDDLADIEQLVVSQGVRVSTLPQNRDRLSERIDLSQRSVDADPSLKGGLRVLLVLEDLEQGKVRGTAAIDAQAGSGQPFYNYRCDELIHSSHELDVSNRVSVLYPTHELTGRTLLCSFTIDQALRHTDAFQLLSRARLMYLAQHREWFGEDMIVEIQGLQTEDGESPFWDSLGRHFFNMDYKTADNYSVIKTKTYIAELMPPHPIYVTLLSDAAQEAIAQPHDDSLDTFRLLQREGFRVGKHIDIFDGGPVLEARVDDLNTINNRRMKTVRRGEGSRGLQHIVANAGSSDFVCTLATLNDGIGDVIRIHADTADALNVVDGDDVAIVAL